MLPFDYFSLFLLHLSAFSFFQSRQLKRIGKGSVVHHPVINEPDCKKLYESINMSLDAPEALLNKVQFDIRLILL
jgi:hypothetical protein